MFVKLLQYDIKTNWKTQMTLLVSIIFLMPVVLLLQMFNNQLLNALLVLPCLLMALGVLLSYAVFHVTGFYRSMVGKESYLTYVLPISVNKIIISKFIAALLWGVINIVSVVCLFWIVALRSDIEAIFFPADITMQVIGTVASQLIYTMTLIAFCISLSVHPMFSNVQSKMATSIIAYIVVYYITAFIQIVVVGARLFMNKNIMNNQLDGLQELELVKDISASAVVVYLILAILFYILAVRIFARKKSI